MNILITSAGRRVSLVRAFRKELRRYFPDCKVLTVDLNPELSSACRDSDGYFQVPRVTDPLYISKLIEICSSNNIKLVIPTIDTELITLAENRATLAEHNIVPVLSSIDVISMCRDKRKTHKYFDSIKFPRAAEIDPKYPHFPLFAKPSDGSSSIGVNAIFEESQLTDSLVNNSNMMFLEYLSPKQYIEYTIDLYFDKHHNLKCAVPRERIETRTGEVSKGVTRKTNLYDLVCSKFSYCPGFIGCITLQVFKNRLSDEIFGIEINPRFGGGYPLSYMARANFPEMIIKEYLLNEEIPFFGKWIENLLMLRFDDEIFVYDYTGDK